MATWKSPSDTQIRVALLSGHTAMVGQEPRDLPDFFDEHLLAAGAIKVAGRRPRKEVIPAQEAADSPETQVNGGLDIEIDDRDAL